MIRFQVSTKCVAQPRHRVGRHGAYIPKDHPVHTFKELTQFAARRAMGSLIPSAAPLNVSLLFALPHSKSHVLYYYTWCYSKPDLDNLQKSVLDAMNGIVYRDDSQIVELRSRKVVVPVHVTPRLYVEVSEIFQSPDLTNDLFPETSES